MTNEELYRLEQSVKILPPGPWSVAYHNRTESFAITYPLEGCDICNDTENLIAQAPDPGGVWDEILTALANLRNLAPTLIKALIDERRINQESVSDLRNHYMERAKQAETKLAAAQARLERCDRALQYANQKFRPHLDFSFDGLALDRATMFDRLLADAWRDK